MSDHVNRMWSFHEEQDGWYVFIQILDETIGPFQTRKIAQNAAEYKIEHQPLWKEEQYKSVG